MSSISSCIVALLAVLAVYFPSHPAEVIDKNLLKCPSHRTCSHLAEATLKEKKMDVRGIYRSRFLLQKCRRRCPSSTTRAKYASQARRLQADHAPRESSGSSSSANKRICACRPVASTADPAHEQQSSPFGSRAQFHRLVLGEVRLVSRCCARYSRSLRCVTGSSFARFSSKEEQCLSNCVDRFLDTSLFIVKKIGEQRR